MSDLIPDQSIQSIAELFGARLILQFGSSVAGRLHPHSDIDIAVLLREPQVGLRERTELCHALQLVFREREVDVALINHADPLFLKQITSCCRLLYGSASMLHELKMYAFRRYQDHKRFLALERAYARRFILEMSVSK